MMEDYLRFLADSLQELLDEYKENLENGNMRKMMDIVSSIDLYSTSLKNDTYLYVEWFLLNRFNEDRGNNNGQKGMY